MQMLMLLSKNLWLLQMLTSEFKYFSFPFYEFNKAQSAVFPYVDRDVNLIVSFPTATGKSAIAEGIFAFHLQENLDQKCVYTSPYRALSMQKFDSWKENEQFLKYGLVLSTGDFLVNPKELDEGRLLLLTTESFDAKTRNVEVHKWLKSVRVVVCDETHLLGHAGRGDKIEVSLMRFTQFNPDARIVFLSATMSNAAELSAWVKSLNKKETVKVATTWRPSKIKTRFCTFENNGFESWNDKKDIVIDLVTKAPFGEKIIVFVHSKKFGQELVQSVRKAGFSCAFHNASLSHKDRQKIESLFNDPYSGFNVLISTSTLSSGVNVG